MSRASDRQSIDNVQLPAGAGVGPTALAVYADRSPTPYGRPKPFVFDGGAGSYVGTALLSMLLTVCTLGLGTPWAVCMRYAWRTKHTIVNGRRLAFTGSGAGLFGNWVKWWALSIITIGIYLFWVVPRLTKWVVEHQTFTGDA